MSNPPNNTSLARMIARGRTLSAWIDEVAKLVYEASEMLAETEGGGMPSWDDLLGHLNDARPRYDALSEENRERVDWYSSIVLSHRSVAEALRNLGPADHHRLAALLLQAAIDRQRDTELQLWRRIEMAEGKPAGSLSGG